MRVDNRGGLACYRFKNLSGYGEIIHGFFARSGGSSPAPFNSLNVGLGLGDDAGKVYRNRDKISRFFGLRELVFLDQVHGVDIRVNPGSDDASGYRRINGEKRGDAMMTDRPGCGLAIQAADCQAVLLFDTRRKIVANIHSGWRGSVQNIVGRTVAVMKTRYATHPADIVAGIGPSLGPCCAEFVHYQKEIPDRFWKYGDEAHRFDFWALTRDQLRRAGVREDRIENGGLCTRCRTDLFYSYRGEGVTGRSAAVIGLRPGVRET